MTWLKIIMNQVARNREMNKELIKLLGEMSLHCKKSSEIFKEILK